MPILTIRFEDSEILPLNSVYSLGMGVCRKKCRGGNDMEIAVGEGSKGRGIPLPLFEKKKLFPKVLRCKMMALLLSNTVAQLHHLLWRILMTTLSGYDRAVEGNHSVPCCAQNCPHHTDSACNILHSGEVF